MPSLDAPSHLVDDPGVDLLYLCSSETARHYLFLLAASGSVGVAKFAEQSRPFYFFFNKINGRGQNVCPRVVFVLVLFLFCF